MIRPLRRLPLVEQVAAHLREGMRNGRWKAELPGVLRLAEELVVSKAVVRAALEILVAEGCVEDRGAGRRKRIVPDRALAAGGQPLRVAMMCNDPFEDSISHTLHVLLGIRQAIEAAGHVCLFVDPCLRKLGHDLAKVARVVKTADADAWILVSAPRKVLEWFAAQSAPVFAFGGRFQELPVASTATSMGPAIEAAMAKLAALGHRRIVMVVPGILRQPVPVPSVAQFLAILESRGIAGGNFHLPDYEETAAGFEMLLGSLFSITPPTAMMILDPAYCEATLAFLARRRLRVPQEVSLISMMSDPVFRLRQPQLACFRWPTDTHVRRIIQWLRGVAKGRVSRRQQILATEFIPGDSIGPAR